MLNWIYKKILYWRFRGKKHEDVVRFCFKKASKLIGFFGIKHFDGKLTYELKEDRFHYACSFDNKEDALSAYEKRLITISDSIYRKFFSDFYELRLKVKLEKEDEKRLIRMIDS